MTICTQMAVFAHQKNKKPKHTDQRGQSVSPPPGLVLKTPTSSVLGLGEEYPAYLAARIETIIGISGDLSSVKSVS